MPTILQFLQKHKAIKNYCMRKHWHEIKCASSTSSQSEWRGGGDVINII